MELSFACPACGAPRRIEVESQSTSIDCPCGWCGTVRSHEDDTGKGEDSADHHRPAQCLVCGCEDLWRQKDFPQGLGLAIVALGMILSTIAWAMYLPWIAIGVLMVFALADLVLYALMPDVLVCYRCKARHRYRGIDPEHSTFDLETAERYRQEQMRLEERKSAGD